MPEMRSQPFSKKWMFASMAIFIAVELFLGGLIGNVVAGKYISISLRFLVQGALNLASYFVGGFLIGLLSPGIRIYEPAAGAFLAVTLMLCVSIFTPFSFIHFSFTKMLIGGGIAFCLALVGARAGELLAGNMIPG